MKSAPAPVIEVQENRWQHPEKQKTLIHTAPVLCPLQPSVLGASASVSVSAAAASAPISSHSSSAGSAIRAVRSKGREDLAKNNKEVTACTHFKLQSTFFFAYC